MIAPRLCAASSIGREHLEFFGSLSGVVNEEGWWSCCRQRMTAEFTRCEGPDCAATFAGGSRDLAPSEWANPGHGLGGTTFRCAPDAGWTGEYTMILPGRHSVVNALLALAVAHELGLNSMAAREGLAAFQPAPQRLRMVAAAGVHILDDTYNASATPCGRHFDLSDLPQRTPHTVLGDMASWPRPKPHTARWGRQPSGSGLRHCSPWVDQPRSLRVLRGKGSDAPSWMSETLPPP
jgi:hypothetical protein